MGFKWISQLLWLAVILALFVVYLRYVEKRSIFYPTQEIEYTPKDFGMAFEDVFFKTRDNLELNGWFLPAENAAFTVLFCHGNAGNISHRVEKLRFFHELGCSIFIFDYREYGRSRGTPSEKGLYNDVRAAYDYLVSRKIAPDKIIGYGESIGGAVIIDLACEKAVGALIADGTPSSAKDMVKFIYPFLPYWIFSTRWDSVKKIRSITVPKLIIHSLNDEIVPYKQGRKLFENAAEPKEFLQIRGGHNSSFFESEQIMKDKISDFLKRIAR